jgi:hypothetical protein
MHEGQWGQKEGQKCWRSWWGFTKSWDEQGVKNVSSLLRIFVKEFLCLFRQFVYGREQHHFTTLLPIPSPVLPLCTVA